MRFMHEVEPEPTALHGARTALESWCAEENVDAESIVIIANELCSNAIRHGSGPVLLHGNGSSKWLSISVSQQGSISLAMPRAISPSELQISSRGLRMVDALSESWGWQSTRQRTLVWARISTFSS